MLGELLGYVEVTRSAVLLAEEHAYDRGEGVWFPDGRPLHPMRAMLATWFPRVNEILITIGSHNLLATPSRAMLDDARLRPLIDEFLHGANGVDAEERAALFRLAWDFVGSNLGARNELYERNYLASAKTNRTGAATSSTPTARGRTPSSTRCSPPAAAEHRRPPDRRPVPTRCSRSPWPLPERRGRCSSRASLGQPRSSCKSERTSIVTWADVTAPRPRSSTSSPSDFPDHADPRRGGPRRTTPTGRAPGSSTRSTARPTTPTASPSRARRWPSPTPTGVVAGAIFEPFRGELFTAVRGGGAWLGERAPEGVDDAERSTAALVCTGVQSDDREAIAGFGRRIVALCTPLPWCALRRLAGAVPRLRRRGAHRRLPRARLDVRLGRRRRRADDHRGRWAHRGPRRRAAQPRPGPGQRAGDATGCIHDALAELIERTQDSA